ncbi:MAG: NAD(P)-dependent oxidoreductase [Opitutales bacterium]
MTDARVLITGSTGCIGAATVDWLLSHGASEVVGLNRTIREPIGDPRYRCLQCDVSNVDDLHSVFREFIPSQVIHLAALQTPECRDHPMRGLEINLVGTINLFKVCSTLKTPLKRFVFASSGGVFGPRELYGENGVQADDPFLPHSLYGFWKIAGEGIAQAFQQETRTPTISLRLATTYGPGRDRGYTASGTRALKSIAMGVPFEIPYKGSEHYHYVNDVGAGFGCAALHPFSGYGAFNLRGATQTIPQFVNLLKDAALACGIEDRFKVSISPDVVDTPFVYELNSDLTETTFPQMPLTGLRYGLKTSLEYYLKAFESGELTEADIN